MVRKIGLVLLTGLMMFPQVVETIYSPALTHIAHGFHVSSEKASQTLSFYFFAFAFGVVFWGRICDTVGRRPAIIGGLLLYGLASLLALFSWRFDVLLAARMLAAFGAAVGSIGTQTIIRDSFKGNELAKVFSVMGIALAISPGLGMLAGSVLTSINGYQGIFTGLAILAAILTIWSIFKLPETHSGSIKIAPLMQTAMIMLSDGAIWKTAFLIAFFNINLFSYYQLAPFHFEKLGLSPGMLGYSGLLLTLGVGIGSVMNRVMLNRGVSPSRIVLIATLLSLAGGILVYMLLKNNYKLFILPVLLNVMAYGLAIPNILASALTKYTHCLGTAGALLGLMYYVLLGGGRVLAGLSQHLGFVLICSSLSSLLLITIVKLNSDS
ncbi:MFS transporter [Arsenophonus sp.]|uniref:MFS transporter n=1 Tax=Arsenophonus sp. TaxID=1872640 RepID=UPI0028557689|nr:MFS transporter [Arsenophonus sp.]MDR5617870.1 MFS transporter [Arsenophonus sp.]